MPDRRFWLHPRDDTRWAWPQTARLLPPLKGRSSQEVRQIRQMAFASCTGTCEGKCPCKCPVGGGWHPEMRRAPSNWDGAASPSRLPCPT